MVKKKKSTKNQKWFVKTRGSYLPHSWQGIELYGVYVGYLLFVLIYAINTQDTVAKVVLFIFPQWVAAIVVMTYVAKNNS